MISSMRSEVTTTALILSALLVTTVGPAWALPSFGDEGDEDTVIEAVIEAMSPEELLGQVFFLGYQGKRPSAHIRRWIAERHVGGIKIFTRNVAGLRQLAADIREMQSLALAGRFGIPLLVATDQEGGWVRHIRSGNAVSPGNMALGAAGIPGDAFTTGYHLGLELRQLGINMNFAPTVDVYSDPSAIVIGPRAFSSDPRLTGLLGLAYFRGMQKAGVVCTAKHYPGHGDTDKDSHGYLPEVNVTFDMLWERDLLPYRFLIKEGIPVIMSGHLAFPEILGDKTPATLSTYFLNDVLRRRMGFDGMVITDDLEMYGVHQNRSDVPSVSLEALVAGNDMILLSHTPALQDMTWNRMVWLMQRDERLRARVEEAVRRVLKVKMRYLRDGFPLLPDPAAVSRNIPSKEAEDFFFNSACRAVTEVRGRDMPYSPKPGERVLLVGQVRGFFQEGLIRIPNADTYEFPYLPLEWSRRTDRQRVPRLAREYDTVIFCLTNRNSLEVLQGLKDFGGKLYVISALTPVYLAQVPWVDSALAVYGMESDSFKAGFGALLGDFEPEGTLPLSERMGVAP